MNIVFIYAECENLGIEYLSACLKKAGHKVSLIFDPMLFGSYYFHSRGLKNLFSFKQRIVDKIIQSDFDLVCFSVFSDYYGWACDISKELKQKKKEIPVVFGGIHPSSVPEHVIKEPFVDYVCVGEGEDALVQLADALEQGKDTSSIMNIWAKDGERVIQNEIRALAADLDKLPFPDKEIFYNEYKGFLTSTYTIVTSRGCPNACSYCYNSYFKNLYKNKGNYLRRRSVDNVIEELSFARKNYAIKRVSFFDDLFVSDLDWLEEFAAKYSRDVNLPYFCHIHPTYINKDSVNMLERSGCSVVTMGLQTIDQGIRRKVLGRGETNDQIVKAVELIKPTRIFLYTSVIFGLPLQDESVMAEDVKFASSYRVDVPASNWLRYYPKTRIVQVARENALLDDEEIKDIEQSKKYLPYSIKGNTYNKTGAKLRNLLLLSQLLPRSLVSFILSRRIYCFFPSANFRFYITAFITTYKRLFSRKRFPFAYFSPGDIIRYHCNYIWKSIFS